MPAERNNAASLILFNGNVLWVTGGLVDNVTQHTTYYVTLNGSWSGPPLPAGVSGHCLVSVSVSTILLVPGDAFDIATASRSDLVESPWTYSIPEDAWTLGLWPK